MAAPYAKIKEQDDSAYLNSELTVNTYIASWAPCGPVGTNLVVNTKTFYNTYTPEGQYKSGYPVAFLNAEAIFNVNSPVYFNRVLPEDALYGGAVVTVGSSSPSYSLPNGISSPDSFIFKEALDNKTNEQITVLCKADSNGSLGGSYFFLPNEKSFIYLMNSARAEQATISCNADSQGSLAGTYFVLPGNSYYVWFKVDATGTDPGSSSLALLHMTGIEIDISANATASTIATAVSTGLSSLSSTYTVSVSDDVVTITMVNAGAIAHGNAGTTGFTYLTSILGVNASQPVEISGYTAIQASINADATAAQVATAINTALTGNQDFSCTIDGINTALLTITAKTAGFMQDARDGEVPTGFVFNTVVQGSNQSGSEAMLFYTADPNSMDISFKIFSHQDNPAKVPDAGTFVVDVFRDGILESEITCSRKKDMVDGLGNPLYVEVAMQASKYLRCRNNEAVEDTEMPVSMTTALKVTGGTPGSNVTTGDMIAAVQPWRNKDDFDVTLMLVAGHTNPAYVNELNDIAKNRGDCCVINSIPYAVENASDYLSNIINYRKNQLNINSSYTATFSSQLQVYNSSLNRSVYIPSDGHIAGAIINASNNYEIFYPILGFKRGTLSNVLDVKRRYSKEEMDALYAVQINPIRYIPGRGIVIWGQKTMQSQSSALDRLNARLLLCSIKPSLQAFLEENIGELNNDVTRDKITLVLGNLFEQIKAKGGILDYEVSCDPIDPNNPNKLSCNVRMQITPAVEYVELTLTLTPSGVAFS